jgi:hypothetical protein
MTAESGSEQLSMAQHPDFVALRERYERASETPQAWTMEGLTFIAGTYVAMSAWVLGFQGGSALAICNLIVGGALALLALGFTMFPERTHGLMWVVPVAGVWVVLAPWIVNGIDRTSGMNLSHIIAGLCLVVLGLGLTNITRVRIRR